MPVYVKLGISAKRAPASRVDSSAKVNTGFTAPVAAELAIPERLAERLGLWPNLPPGAYACEVPAAGGPASAHVCPEACRVEVVTDDRVQGPVDVDVLILHQRRDVLISDALAEALLIVIVKPATGLWRFVDEPDRLRPSAPPQLW